MKNLARLEQVLGAKFKNRDYLKEAMTHASYLNEDNSWPHRANQRLALLGGEVLHLIVAHHLYTSLPNTPPGQTTTLQNLLISTETCIQIAVNKKLKDHLLMGKSETSDTAGIKYLSDFFKALVGALYLDQGMDVATKFVIYSLEYKFTEIEQGMETKDPKTLLQEKVQAQGETFPTYKIISSKGPQQNPVYTAGVYFEEELIAKGKGASKKAAEKAAAKKALQIKGWL